MSYTKRQAVYWSIAFLVIGGGTWWWFANMEKRWTAVPQFFETSMNNPMLGATRLLQRHGHVVTIAGTLAEAQRGPIADGTLIMADNGGLVTREQAAILLAWAKRGNTLIMRPKWTGRTSYFSCGESSQGAPPTSTHGKNTGDADPISAEFGVELANLQRRPKPKTAPDASNAANQSNETAEVPEARGKAALAVEPCVTHLVFPGADHALQLNADGFALKTAENKTAPLFGDDNLDAVRVYAHGNGHVVFLASNDFDSERLAWYDNAELLLGLADLQRGAKHVLIVQHLDMPSWYQVLWWQFKLGIVSAACGLALLFWLAVRRFGPLLPEPDRERRSLIEHIDAGGRWLWKVPSGHEILLAAVRTSTERLLLRRAPELLRLSPEQRAAQLAQSCKLPQARVVSALLGPAAKLPQEFTRQIQTLQQLRKHHER